jgi:hypothetical protein
LIGFHDRLLFDKAAARVEDLSNLAFKDAEFHTIKGDLNTVAGGTGASRFGVELTEEAACAFRGGWREIEEGVPTSAAVASLGTIEGAGTGDYRLACHGD